MKRYGLLRRKPLIAMLSAATLFLPCGIAFADITVNIGSSSTSVTKSSLINEVDTSTGHLSFNLNGAIDFNDAEDDVVAIDGKAKIKELRDGHTREIIFTPASGGGVARTYYVDGHEHAFDADGKRWLGGIIPSALRASAFNVEKRSKRIYAKGGVDAMFAEIEAMQTDFARRAYIDALNGLARLDDKSVARLLADTAAMTGDFERRSAYIDIIGKQTLSVANMCKLLNGVAAMQSDFEKRTVMVTLVPKLVNDEALRQSWQNAVRTVQSDFEKRTIVVELSEQGVKPICVDWALASVGGIQAAFERRTALVDISSHMQPPSAAQVVAYAKAAKHIDSDFERRTALVALVDKSGIDKEGYFEVLQAIDGMGSDFEIRTVLVAVARAMPADPELINRYRKVARHLGDFERVQAEKALDRLG